MTDLCYTTSSGLVIVFIQLFAMCSVFLFEILSRETANEGTCMLVIFNKRILVQLSITYFVFLAKGL